MNYSLIFIDIRKQIGLTQVELAERIGVNRSMIASIENGKQKPTLEIISLIVEFFHIDANLFFGISAKQHSETDSMVCEEPLPYRISEKNGDCSSCIEKEKRIEVMAQLLEEKERLIKVLLEKK